MEVIHTSPSHAQFTPLSTFQSQTPESFHSGPPILYHHSPSTTLKIHASELHALPALTTLAHVAQRQRDVGGATLNGDIHHEDREGETEEQDEEDEQLEISGIEIWVTSESVFPP